MSSKEIQILVKEAKSGNAEAFGELYALYNREMFGYACYYLGDRYRAEDAVSDAVCEAFAGIESLRNAEKFKSWLFKILLRSCRKQMRYIISRRSETDIDAMTQSIPGHYSFEEESELKQVLSLLKDDEREILLLSCVGKYKSREIGDMLGMPPGTVRSKLKRSADKMYQILTDERSGEDEK